MEKINGEFGIPTPIIFYKDSFFTGTISEIARLATGDTKNIDRYPTFYQALMHIQAEDFLTWDGHIAGVNGWTAEERKAMDDAMFCNGAVKVTPRETKSLVNNTTIIDVVLHEVDINTIATLFHSTLKRHGIYISSTYLFDYLCEKIQKEIDASGYPHIDDVPAVMSNANKSENDFYRNVLHMNLDNEKPYVVKPAYYTIAINDFAKEYNRIVEEMLPRLAEYKKEFEDYMGY